MQELLDTHGTELLVLSIVFLGVVAFVVPLVCFSIQWTKVRHAEIEALMYRAELEATLKQEMVSRGMSGDEMRQVLEATPGGGGRPFAGLFGFLRRKHRAPDAKAWEDFGKKWACFGKKFEEFGKRPFGCGKT
jgi:hypothetical protein